MMEAEIVSTLNNHCATLAQHEEAARALLGLAVTNVRRAALLMARLSRSGRYAYDGIVCRWLDEEAPRELAEREALARIEGGE